MKIANIIVTSENVENVAEVHKLDVKILRKKVEEATARNQYYMLTVYDFGPDNDH